jgi:hypothetical protein
VTPSRIVIDDDRRLATTNSGCAKIVKVSEILNSRAISLPSHRIHKWQSKSACREQLLFKY